MLARDIMTCGVRLLAPHGTLQEAARQMRDDDIGSRAEGDQPVGRIPDRGPVVRGLAEGLSGGTHIHGVMTDRVLDCSEGGNVALSMARNRSRRLPGPSGGTRLVGILVLGDLATKAPDIPAEDALKGVSKPKR